MLFSNGGQNALAAIFSGVFKAGDEIGVDPFAYPGMKTAAKMLGIQLIPISQENGEMSKEGILYACKQENIKGLYIIPDYQNPTTHIMSEECRKMIAEVAKEKNLIVIEDSIYSFLLEKHIKSVASYAPDNTIYLYSLSKTVAPGLRLGYIVSPLKYKKDLFNALYNMNITVSPFMLEIASRMIVSKSIYKLMARHRKLTKERNKIVDKYLGEFNLIGDENCIFK
ncbi:PLP-dependent aminotransferase family protein [Intestinibacter bartlettii]|uniref:PLP-dependent aminotransferase family protein n=1 Tax=Intestinibacter bartlettii TaxID=261299 RepID=UPI00321ADE70